MDIFRWFFSVITTLVVILTPQNSYTEGLVGQPFSFLPNEVTNEAEKTISELTFRSLFVYNNDGEIVSDLAESYDISEDGLSYTVYLKTNQRWSNGQEITADDLLYSAFTSSKLSEIATDKIDNYTIRYTLPNKYSPFLNLLTGGVSPAIQKNDKFMPVSSGPYKVVRVKRDGPVVKEVLLQKIDKTYSLNRLSFRFYESDAQLITAAKLGEIDGFTSSKNLDLPSLNKNIYFQRGIYYSLILNTRNDKLKDAALRKKLVKATPNERIAKLHGIPADGPISESPFRKETLKFDEYDSTFRDDLKLTVTLTLPDTEEHLETGNIIKEAWKNIGVEVVLNPVDRDQIETVIVPTRDFEILLYGQEVSRDPDRYSLWHSARVSHPGLNISGFENLRGDKALEAGRNDFKEEERIRHYGIFQDVIFENAPAIFLYHPSLNFYTSKRVKIVKESKMYYAQDRFLDVKDWGYE